MAQFPDGASLVQATCYAWMRALNAAGYDIADGAVGLYTLATDANAREQLATRIGNAMAHPARWRGF
jgi:hypothetical protein